MRIGVFDHVDRGAGPLHAFYEERLRLVEEYDRAGFYAYHVAEHHATPLGCAPSPSVYLAAVAQRTRRLRFGPLVFTLPLYHPLRLIDEICMLDQMSGGRLELGVGRGISPFEVGYFGIDPAISKAMHGEALQVVLRGLATRSLSFTGAHYNFRDVPIELEPFQTPHPPLWNGISGADSVPWAAANAVSIVGNLPAAMMRTVTDRYRAEWARLGRAADALPNMAVSRHVVVAGSTQAALDIARPAYRKWRESFLILWRKHDALPPSGAIFPETFEEAQAQGRGVAGTAEQVRDFLGDTVTQGGLNYLLCRFAFGDMPVEASIESARRFAAEVMPALAG